jgi:hypothetical protein
VSGINALLPHPKRKRVGARRRRESAGGNVGRFIRLLQGSRCCILF